MSSLDIEKIIEDQGRAASKRQSQLKRMLVGAFIYITLVATVLGGVITAQTRTINKQSSQNEELVHLITERSPILDYLKCRDVLTTTRDRKQTSYIFAYIESNGSSNNSDVIKLKNEYREAEENLSNSASCPDLP